MTEIADITIHPKKLVLFDIDGTLLHCGSSARESMAQAISEEVGSLVELLVEDVAGSTDLAIMQQALSRHGVLDGDTGGVLARVTKRYLEIMKVAYPARDDQYLYPGIRELLEKLNGEPGIRLGLLTGNLIDSARVKLANYGIWEYFRVGAFGSDATDRNELPGVAWKKAAQELGEQYTPEQTVLIGDTPRDALCARANGIRGIIICRRPEWREQVQEHFPAMILDSSVDYEAIWQMIIG